MGCPTGNCPVIAHAPEGGGERERDIVQALAMEGRDDLPANPQCCAFCAGIILDPSIPPEPAGRMLKRGRACPISIVAYRAAVEAKNGRTVGIVPRGNLPALVVDGAEIDPLEDYRAADCVGCE